ncbi:MAG: prolyl oligopeptidase family serine peptidase, partial [Candidatus Marinimicrobia bacterium]|nr:prolyl oligopeptidase family serine peptidase [Candidatus Neomarinimicrobiota bacterium]
VLIDFDKLSAEEGENWVYKGATGLPPTYDRFLIELSRGGKDAVVVREFDVRTKSFVQDGFNTEEAKQTVSWIDENTVFLSTDFGTGTMTESGYPSTIRIWKRGEDFNNKESIASVPPDYVAIWGWTQFNHDKNYSLISRSVDFWTHDILLVNDAFEAKKLNIPTDADFQGIWQDRIFILLRSNWDDIAKGSLVAVDLDGTHKSAVLTPGSKSAILAINFTSTHVLITVQGDVVDHVLRVSPHLDGWKLEKLALPENGTLTIKSAGSLHPDFFYTHEDLITPTTLGYLADATSEAVVLQQLPARFKSDDLELTQKFAISKDGTRVPYFLVAPKGMELDGNNPTLLYGYGGFEVSEKSEYWGKMGKLWMEKGGVFALANIRGGGEYGPAWHQAALKTNRHKSYEDFFAVSEDLIDRGITSPPKLGIMGGSGGGLLVGVAFTMRPDLYHAVVSQVPLLDMLRYHKLLAGASWMGEYGDPDDPLEGAYLKAHSPYHLLSPDVNYPKPLFVTSTKDDRVHPAHARKMTARMIEQGHPVMYWENIEGGHAAGSNLKQYAFRSGIEFTYLHQMLMD